jgi:multimeric flavodoxin WrbA
MKVTAINGSPRLSKGHTAQVLEPFIEGMRKAGTEVSLIYASKLKIKPCIGDFSCWYNKPGECIFQDDMQSVYQLLTDSDMLILATPVYIPLPGAMQNLINRLCPLFEPILENRNGRTRAQFHSQIKIRKILLVATCAWWESGNFSTVKRIVEEMAVNANVEFGGAILRPHSFLLDRYPEDKRKILASLEEAGYQLAKTSGIPPATLETIAKPLISFEDYMKDMNDQYFRIETSQKSHKQQ